MELRQLRYFATLSDELHFGHAAAREHIVQSALSQQIARLERELGVPLVERSTHHVRLTAAGELFVVEVRKVLDDIDRAKAVARSAIAGGPVLRVAVGDASFDSMPRVLRALQLNQPDLEIHRVEAGVPEQCRLLAEGRLDVGIGRASRIPPQIASEVLRRDPMGVLVADCHPLADLESIPVVRLDHELLVSTEDSRAPEFNEFVDEMCRLAGFTPSLYPGTVQSVRCAADLVSDGECVACVPSSCGVVSSQTRWVPLVQPVALYPWSLLWRAKDPTPPVAVLECARGVSDKLGWLDPDDVWRSLLIRGSCGDHIL
jgi:DNA-binding transcriptional LysR family regulator